ncbi:MAG: hypothetical protein APF77_21540 [Clostridia bacterium BRH_c25]|nr:MAG: hypothetical protein APF77_21540 [Clostridia bacterium BRH_c25]
MAAISLIIVKGFKEISQPVVVRIKGLCEHCGKDDCECGECKHAEVGKYETHIYNRKIEIQRHTI